MRSLRRRAAARLFPASRRPKRDDAELLARIRRDVTRIAAHFGLTYTEIFPERPQVRSRYGVCYADGRIAVRLRHARSGEALKYSSLINTVCHELAHLRHFNHGPRFKRLYLEILEYARREGVYRPGRTSSESGVQLELFGGPIGPRQDRIPRK